MPGHSSVVEEVTRWKRLRIFALNDFNISVLEIMCWGIISCSVQIM